MNEKLLRLLVIIFTAALHLIIIFFLVIHTQQTIMEEEENARVMKVTDLDELPPPPPEVNIPKVEAIAETMIETETPPVQIVVPAGTLETFDASEEVDDFDNYIPMHKISVPPKFDQKKIALDLKYPPMAQRAGIEGNVILELFIDRNGIVQQVKIMKETPEDRGFGEAAVKAFMNRKADEPAIANGEAVSARYRYPVTFKLK